MHGLFAPALSAGILCLFALTAQAQQLYKNVMPDGRVIYSDAPVAGASRSQPMAVPAPPPADPQAAQKRAGDEKRQAEDLEARLEARRKAGEEADARVAKARKALEDAQIALERGRELREGDMIAYVGGGARPSDAYLKRQETLERQLVNARKDLDDALRARNRVR
jgi:hypothetical protein